MITILLNKMRKMADDFFLYHSIAANRIKMRWALAFHSHHARVTGKPSPSGLTHAIYNSIKDLTPELWDDCNKNKDIFLSYDYLLALENAPPSNMKFRYVLFYDKDRTVAIAYFQIVELSQRLHQPLRNLPETKNNRGLHDALLQISNTITLRLLVCGNILLSGEHGFAYKGNNETHILHGIAEAAHDIRKSENPKISATLIKDFFDSNSSPANILADFGYHAFNAGPNMVIPIRQNWSSFDEYLKQMKSKYRSKVKGAVIKANEVIKKSLEPEDIARYNDRLYELYGEVVDAAKFKLFFLSPGYFIELKKRLGERFGIDAYFIGEQIIGFTTRIYNNNVIEGYVHGLSYDLNKSYELYQNFLIDDIQTAISSKSSRINLGRTSIAMKSSFGAVCENMKCYIRFSGRISNQLIKPLFSFIKPSDEYCRNPFEE